MKRPYPTQGELDAAQGQQDGMNAGSAFDCTGLIPAIADGDEYESYAELYDFLPPTPKKP